MKDNTRQLVDKAGRAIEAAENLRASGYGEFAAGRAYYAMFYVVEALLNEKTFASANMVACTGRSVSIL